MVRKGHLKILSNDLPPRFYKIEEALLFLIFFLSPSQLSKHFWFPWSFIFGIRIDYLSFSLSLVDILIYFLFFVFIARSFFLEGVKARLFTGDLMLLLFLVLVNVTFSLFPLNTLFYFFKIIPLFLLFSYLFSFSKERLSKIFLSASALSLVFFGVVGVLQVLIGRTLGGFFWFLGERSFNINTAGIALFSFFGKGLLRAYSTFPHPNVLSGFFVVVCLLLLLISHEYDYRRKLVSFVIIFSILPFILSFSFNSFIALPLSFFASFLICRFSKKYAIVFFSLVLLVNIFFVFILPKDYDFGLGESVKERTELLLSARGVFFKNPLFGVGLNNFIPTTFYLEGGRRSMNYLLQPVHNIFILFLTEAGVFGSFILCFFFVRCFSLALSKKNLWLLTSLIFIMLTGLFDHYWLTLDQGRLALVFLISFLEKYGKSR